MEITEFAATLLTPIAQVGLIIGIAEVIKKIGLPAKWIPLIDLALGLILGITVDGLLLGYGILQGVLIGLALGLSACGLFSGIKNVTHKDDDDA